MECVTETMLSVINYEPGTPIWEAYTAGKQTTWEKLWFQLAGQ